MILFYLYILWYLTIYCVVYLDTFIYALEVFYLHKEERRIWRDGKGRKEVRGREKKRRDEGMGWRRKRTPLKLWGAICQNTQKITIFINTTYIANKYQDMMQRSSDCVSLPLIVSHMEQSHLIILITFQILYCQTFC